MKFVIEGDYNRELITSILKKELPVSHIIIHAPHNPIGNSSIFLPEKLPSLEEFKSYTKFVQENDLIPIIGIDSTCQGNLEAHIDQFKATKSFLEELIGIGCGNVLVSSPNNIGLIKKNYPSLNISLSYSQVVTSTNRAKIFFHMGVDTIILHPDILRYFNAIKNFLKLQIKYPKIGHTNYILPLNIGCNWGCIYWFDHHNMQSHRTMNSPVFPDQSKISDLENEFDYPMLNCWKKRMEQPDQLFKAGWISPYNINKYEDLGYDSFLLFTQGFSTKKILRIIDSYLNKTFEGKFNEILNIPMPYGNYWSKEKINKSIIQLNNDLVEDFCNHFPYNKNYFPFEDNINVFCSKYAKKCKVGDAHIKEKVLLDIEQNLQKMERGAISE